jgi:HlyD family secretion protein
LSLDNADLSLRPGMTATADITVKEVPDTIMVPNAALRFTPQVKEKGASGNQKNLVNALLPGPRRRNAQRLHRSGNATQVTPLSMSGVSGSGRLKKQGQVWTLQAGKPFPVSVMIGVTDGVMTEITGGDVTPGMALVVDQVGAS